MLPKRELVPVQCELLFAMLSSFAESSFVKVWVEASDKCCHLNVNAHPDPLQASGDVINCVASIFGCGTKNWPQEDEAWSGGGGGGGGEGDGEIRFELGKQNLTLH